jgi:hypothetical protein
MSRIGTEVRRNLVSSYLEKLIVVLIAVAAFVGLAQLGKLTDERKFVVDHKALDTVAKAANQIVQEKAATDTATATQSRRGAAATLEAIAKSFASPVTPEPVTAQELTTHIEHLADESIWNDYKENVSRHEADYQKQLDTAAKSKDPKTSLSDVNGSFANYLASDEALARGRVAATHALIEAAVVHLRPEDPSVLKRMADEKSSLHVLFEMSWYACLILGVLACSYLVMTVFTALPFTSFDGEWTKRLEEILKSAVPGMAHAAILPLAAAAVIGGTVLAGTTYATVPGGGARGTTNKPTLELHPTIEFGDSPSYDNRQFHHPGLTAGELVIQLRAAIKSLNDHTTARTDEVKECVKDAKSVLEAVDTSVGEVAVEAVKIRSLADDANENASRAGASAEAAHQVAKTIDTKIDERSTSIAAEQEKQDALQQHSIARAAAADDRGFWKRTFGFTQFKVGPAVVDAMDARLADEKLSPTDRETVHHALVAMSNVPALNRWKFEQALERHQLPRPMIDCYIHTLLRLSALPRD